MDGAGYVDFFFGIDHSADVELSTLDVVLQTISGLTGQITEPEMTLAEVGLASVAAPVIISLLSNSLPGITIRLPDLVATDTVGELADLLEMRRQELNMCAI